MSEAAPRFSVVMPTYRRAGIVERMVAALDRQTERSFEAIVVVDGDADDSAARLRALDTTFPLTVIEQENAGAATARNTGASAARGDLLLFLDDDMEADPGLLAAHAASHAAGADIVIGHLPLHPDSPPTLISEGVGGWAQRRRERLESARENLPLDDLLTGQMSVEREAFLRLGGFDGHFTRDGLYGGEDLDFGYRALQDGMRIDFNPEAISYQYYDVDPEEYLKRSYETGRSDEELRVKHPDRAGRATTGRRLETRTAKILYAPFVVLPGALGRPLRAAVSGLVRAGRRSERVRRSFFAARTMEYQRGVRDTRRALSTGHAVVLAYHAVEDLSGDRILGPYGVPPARLGAQLDALRRAGRRFITLDTLLEALAGRTTLPRGAVLVTFDDAYVSVLETGVPELRRRGVPAVVFAVAGHTGGTNAWDHKEGRTRLELLDADGLHALTGAAIEIGSHTVSHRQLPTFDDAALDHELTASADLIEGMGLPRPRALAYPYGAFDERVAAATRAAGYEVAFTIEAGAVERGTPRMLLPRIEVLAEDGPFALTLKVFCARHPRLRRVLGRVRQLVAS